MYFNFDIPIVSIALFAAALLLICFVIAVCVVRLRRVAIAASAEADDTADDASLPSASVIVYAQDDPENLERVLMGILEQDYPAKFEVIVVNEGASETTRQVVGRMKIHHPDIYLTFTPDGARSLSRKKLALTLGVKAARNEVVLITDDTSCASSPLWMQTMLRHFAHKDVEVVLGYSTPDFARDTALGKRTRAFDFGASAVTWISAALARRPYRGCSSNVAYRRQLFFDNKGFSRSLNLRYGDDDIFINEITDRFNTVVEISPDSILNTNIYNFKRFCRRDRLTHSFTGRMLPKGSRRLMAASQWAMWLVVIASVGGAAFAGMRNGFGWCLAAVLIIAMFVVVALMWRKALTALRNRRMLLTLPWLAMTRPMRDIITNIRSRFSTDQYYTWS